MSDDAPGYGGRERLVRIEGEIEALRRGFRELLRLVERHAARLDARPEPAPEAAPEPERRCRACGEPLTGRRPQTRFCGDPCRKRAGRVPTGFRNATPSAGY